MSWICSRFSILFIFLSISCLYLTAIYFDRSAFDILNFRASYGRTLTNGTPKTILFWKGMFGHKTFYFDEDDIFLNCLVNQCYATYDTSYSNIEDFDAILFHGAELDSSDLPKGRSTKQYYVFVNLESPVNRPIKDATFEEYFNATMTYRLDSDVVWPYGIVRNLKTDKIVAPSTDVVWDVSDRDENTSRLSSMYQARDAALMSTIAGKRKEVAWLVSNCPAKSGRWDYVTKLSKYIGVDIYGICGDRYACPYKRDCFRELFEPSYFFYLSFENSLCQDYVTEKLYKPMRYDIIPIVYGGANYSRFAPPDSYINALDYDDPKDLAKYLKKLIANPREYRKYFRWKERYRVEDSISSAACSLCEFLHTENEAIMSKPLSSWYSHEKCPLQRLLNTQKFVTRAALKDLA